MSAIIGPTNPIAWSQFHLKGGWKTVLAVSLGYFTIISGIMALSWWANPHDHLGILEGWTVVLTVIQCFALMLLGTVAVSSAIKQDVASGIVESHRMMPIPPSHVIGGYITGAPALALGMFVVNLIIGCILSVVIGRPLNIWLITCGVLLSFSLFIWTIAVFASLIAKYAGIVVIMAGGFAFFSQDGIARLTPAIVVVAGPLLGGSGSVFDIRQHSTEIGVAMLLSIAAQILLGAIFFVGAVRKFRKPDQLALSSRLGIGLLFVWVLLNIEGIVEAGMYFGGFAADDHRVAFIGSTISSMLLAIIVLANSSREFVHSYKRRIDDPETVTRALHPLTSGLIAGTIICLLLCACPFSKNYRDSMLLTAIVIFSFCISIAFVTARRYDTHDGAKWPIIFWLIATWILPFVAAVIVKHDDDIAWTVAAFSPPGAFAMIWGHAEGTPWPGTLAQAIFALLPISRYLIQRRQPQKLDVATIPTTSY